MAYTEWEKTYLKFVQTVSNSKKLEKALKSWNFDKKAIILDICCGSGPYFETFLNSNYKNIYGIDFSANLLSRVKAPVALIQANALKCPLKENSFDVVIINKALHHFHEFDSLIGEIRKILKPGGYFCFIEPRKTWFRTFYHHCLLSPITKYFPALESYKEAALITEGETYFMWLATAQNFFKTLEDHFHFTIESIQKDLLHYVVKCKNNS